MCGRLVVSRTSGELAAFFDVDVEGDDLPEPSFNTAPTQRVSVIIDALNRQSASDPDAPDVLRRLASARWGLVPGFAKDPAESAPLFNARIETAHEKPAFRSAVASRRAAIPASGYYEWLVEPDGTKVAQFVHSGSEEPLLLAGLYEWWRNPVADDGDPARWLLSTTILTREGSGPLASLHDRMPVLLEPGLMEDWLDPRTTGDRALLDEISLAAADLADDMEFYAVSSAVGNVRNNSPELIERVA
ncbi:SOS response-associated peptidase [Agreia sp. COWG]|uniref:SOS response-associated peptidase n=1 Tax=Agreia sp. COWG TaxID=2773266 RepID=UPI0019288326|nr:SOS response-associated peptidase [Agreia sp. COWG]CAD5996499.1 Putative SOS response-associated peptidase [Agreia sp. COWG]